MTGTHMIAKKLLCAALLMGTACACHRDEKPSSTQTASVTTPVQRPVEGKPQAPVTIDGQLANGTAQLSVRFDQPAKDVEIRAEGVRGLTVQHEPLLTSGATVVAGQTLTFSVPYTPGAGESMLAVNVRGAFPGGVRTAVRAFVTGSPAAGPTPSQGSANTTVKGSPVELVPADSH